MSQLVVQFGEQLRNYIEAIPTEAQNRRTQTVKQIAEALISGDASALNTAAIEDGRLRAESGEPLSTLIDSFAELRTIVWTQFDATNLSESGWGVKDSRIVEDMLHSYRGGFLDGFNQIYVDIQNRLEEQAQQLEDQQRTIRDLSTPIVPIHEGIMVLPLVGGLDARRASQVVEAVLDQIVAYQADILIVDITGVPVVDTGVANHLLMMTRAVRLLGAQVVVVGISAEIAQTIVQLGVDLGGIITLANLQAGITYALDQLGFAIRPVDITVA
jgi:rsbT co-antagonist protein RsbR